ncbi:hypothetical protein V1294_006051 [Bradyrhizobium sp. AZCC 1678]|uniref:hypothetical protein n=1 Tax=Bradyrhizobium sp. AZCC 1678 TaxID=3117030 RepID=UPI002FF24533
MKDSKATKPKRDRKKPTRAKAPVVDEIREGRLMMRVHADLVHMLDIRAKERGESRSRYIEKLLVAFLRADPRNPKIDAVGRIDAEAPAPLKAPDPLRFGERWARWVDINDKLLGFRVPDEWLDDEWGYFEWAKRAVDNDEK